MYKLTHEASMMSDKYRRATPPPAGPARFFISRPPYGLSPEDFLELRRQPHLIVI